MRLRLLPLALVACHGGDDGDVIPPHQDTTTIPDDTGPEPTDTGIGGGVFIDGAFFGVRARFGYDPDLAQIVEFAEPGEGFSPVQLSVVIIDSSFVSTQVLDASNSCEVRYELAGPVPAAAWVGSLGAWGGFDVPADAEVKDRCQDYGLSSEFSGDAREVVQRWAWGAGVGELPDVVRETLEATLPASEWAALEPYIVGSIGVSTVFEAPYGGTAVNIGYTVAHEVDGNFEIVVGGTGNPVPIPAADVYAGDTLARGYYEVNVGPFAAGPLTAE